MLGHDQVFPNAVFVGVGAISGSWLRLKFSIQFSKIFRKQFFGTAIINLISTFCLGFLMATLSNIQSMGFDSPFYLFIGIGFLGSLSTFSAFIFELFVTIRDKKIIDFILLLILSIFGGLLFAASGYLLGLA